MNNMKRILPITFIAAAAVAVMADETTAVERLSTTHFDKTVFYDGYQDKKIFDAELEDGIFRFRNHTYSIKLTDEFCDAVGENAELDLILGALCDNYDRFASMSIAFVPKGSEDYNPWDIEKIEIARYITPFMNKNKDPKEVPFHYDLPDLGLLLRDKSIRQKYDLWLEAYVFGVPYAANTQVAGCADRSDVFALTSTFSYEPSSDALVMEPRQHVVPIAKVRSEEHGCVNFNNYKEEATDTLGKTTKTWKFEVPADVTDGKIVLINTNHGAAQNGEEYVRREHIVYVDGEVVMVFKPGGISCEPYRKYNTQGNGIYGSWPKGESGWTWNNWCPGQAVPIREIALGEFKAGEHEVMIRVPDAVFYGSDGDFRPAMYFQGVEEGKLPSTVIREEQSGVNAPELDIEWRREGNVFHFGSQLNVTEASVYTYDGIRVLGEFAPEQIDLTGCAPGQYIITLTSAEGASAFRKVVVE